MGACGPASQGKGSGVHVVQLAKGRCRGGMWSGKPSNCLEISDPGISHASFWLFIKIVYSVLETQFHSVCSSSLSDILAVLSPHKRFHVNKGAVCVLKL